MNSLVVFVGYFLSLFLAFSWAYAGEEKGSIVLYGSGSQSSPPEFTTVNLLVTSICYESSKEAASANSKLALEILKVLDDYKQGARDRVTAVGGANFRRTEKIETGDQPKILCEMKWHSENRLRLETANIENLPEIQDALTHAITEFNSMFVEGSSQTYAELERPEFGVYPESSKRLRNAAQVAAYDDAKEQFSAYQTRCPFKNPKLTSITPPEYNYAMKRLGVVYAPGEGRMPVIPDEIEISAQIKLTWEFEPTTDCKR